MILQNVFYFNKMWILSRGLTVRINDCNFFSSILKRYSYYSFKSRNLFRCCLIIMWRRIHRIIICTILVWITFEFLLMFCFWFPALFCTRTTRTSRATRRKWGTRLIAAFPGKIANNNALATLLTNRKNMYLAHNGNTKWIHIKS